MLTVPVPGQLGAALRSKNESAVPNRFYLFRSDCFIIIGFWAKGEREHALSGTVSNHLWAARPHLSFQFTVIQESGGAKFPNDTLATTMPLAATYRADQGTFKYEKKNHDPNLFRSPTFERNRVGGRKKDTIFVETTLDIVFCTCSCTRNDGEMPHTVFIVTIQVLCYTVSMILM